MQGMLVIAEVEVVNCVRWLHRKGLSVLFKAGFSVLGKCKTSLLSRNNWRIAREGILEFRVESVECRGSGELRSIV